MDMRISSVYNAYSVQSNKVATGVARAEKNRNTADELSLSARAEGYQAARNAVSATPDIREDLVSRIQAMLSAGTYRVSAQDVAASILRA